MFSIYHVDKNAGELHRTRDRGWLQFRRLAAYSNSAGYRDERSMEAEPPMSKLILGPVIEVS